eukprot:CAMPEP_0198312362 /NCGR_PEP_ID=MMETSP1450-20131203/3734_1 /TAXON_ID=753684 ORGANISM="Madagascaria erythrocladiodes, Strain CCMP3234" /NCGR_SAMPLE_ID=MMETSP1450 /ASSEMBLY_ACC=CAM_ASM_001115 /LENGTH=222 /DNA_ID=CAMNT_0044015307 /DNA_START=241 /DNA_END=905 /DNA_ORIENTATION=+
MSSRSKSSRQQAAAAAAAAAAGAPSARRRGNNVDTDVADTCKQLRKGLEALKNEMATCKAQIVLLKQQVREGRTQTNEELQRVQKKLKEVKQQQQQAAAEDEDATEARRRATVMFGRSKGKLRQYMGATDLNASHNKLVLVALDGATAGANCTAALRTLVSSYRDMLRRDLAAHYLRLAVAAVGRLASLDDMRVHALEQMRKRGFDGNDDDDDDDDDDGGGG